MTYAGGGVFVINYNQKKIYSYANCFIQQRFCFNRYLKVFCDRWNYDRCAASLYTGTPNEVSVLTF